MWFRDIGHMHRASFEDRAAPDRCVRDGAWGLDRNWTMVRYATMDVPLYKPDDYVVRTAKTRGALGHGIEHRLNIRWWSSI